MAETRDEVIEAARSFIYGRYAIDDDLAAEKEIIVMADFALSRETELRRQIADELEWVKASPTNFIDLCKSLEAYIEKLRGKQ